jgi:glutamyl-tRNA(Gln) amidotransferase subunit E
MAEVFAALKGGRFAKEAVEPLLKALDADPSATLDKAMTKANIGAAVDTHAVDAVIAKVIASKADLVRSKGMAAMGPLMGPVMAELRGKADGAVINARLKAALEKAAEA